MGRTVGFDLGATYIRFAEVNTRKCKVVGQNYKMLTPDMTKRGMPKDLVRLISGEIKKVFQNIDCLGGSICSPVDTEGIATALPNVFGRRFYFMPLASLFRRVFSNTSVVLHNDVAAATFTEARVGAGRNVRSFTEMTVSSGVGSKTYSDGRVLIGWRGIGGEIGHDDQETINPIACGCGFGKGHLETYASGKAAKRVMRKLAEERPVLFKTSTLYEMGHTDHNQLDTFKLAEAIKTAGKKRGENFEKAVLQEVVKPMARGIRSSCVFFMPERVIIMGGFANGMGEHYMDALRDEVRRIGLFGVKPITRDFMKKFIVPSPLGDDAGLIGAAIAAAQSKGSHS